MEETVVPKKEWEVRQEEAKKARTEEFKKYWSNKLLLGSRVIEKVSGVTGEVYKFYDWGVEVWVRDMNNNRQNWPWDRLATRFPRKIKRYPRPFRFPREKPSEVCHCKIGRIEVEGPHEARCQRCKFLIGSESFPRRIRRAASFIKKKFSEQATKRKVHPRMAGRKRKASHPHAGRKIARRVGVRIKRRKEESVHAEIQGEVQRQDHPAISPPAVPQASIPSPTVPENQKVATVSAP